MTDTSPITNYIPIIVALLALLGTITVPRINGKFSRENKIIEHLSVNSKLFERMLVVLLRSNLIDNYYKAQREVSDTGIIRKYTYMEHRDTLEQYLIACKEFKITNGVIEDIKVFFEKHDHELIV